MLYVMPAASYRPPDALRLLHNTMLPERCHWMNHFYEAHGSGTPAPIAVSVAPAACVRQSFSRLVRDQRRASDRGRRMRCFAHQPLATRHMLQPPSGGALADHSPPRPSTEVVGDSKRGGLALGR